MNVSMSRTMGKASSLPDFLQDRNRPDVDHLMHRRSERDSGAGHPGDPRAPHPAGDHDVFGLDPALVGHHRLDPPSLCFQVASISALAKVCSAPFDCAFSRKIVPARSESTADTVG